MQELQLSTSAQGRRRVCKPGIRESEVSPGQRIDEDVHRSRVRRQLRRGYELNSH
jgi:hypothetical protein